MIKFTIHFAQFEAETNIPIGILVSDLKFPISLSSQYPEIRTMVNWGYITLLLLVELVINEGYRNCNYKEIFALFVSKKLHTFEKVDLSKHLKQECFIKFTIIEFTTEMVRQCPFSQNKWQIIRELDEIWLTEHVRNQ